LRSAKDETGTKYGDNEDDNYLLKYTSDGQDNTLDIR
jgi:hypothetical protein